MKKNGFTLVELLATITILAILAVVSVVAIESTLKKTGDKSTIIQKESIISAAKAYVADNLSTCRTGCNIHVDQLVEQGLLEEKEENKIDGAVIVTKTGNKFKYEYKFPDLNDFTINNSGVLSEYTGDSTEIIIPNSVTTIGVSVFKNKQLTSVIIPNSVTKIEPLVFSDNELTSVIIPDSVTSIGNYAFALNSLTSIKISNNIEIISEGAFAYNQLTSVTIPSNVEIIATNAFAENPNLTEIIIQGKSRLDEFDSLGDSWHGSCPVENIIYQP